MIHSRMKTSMAKLGREYKTLFANHLFVRSFLVGLAALLISLGIHAACASYATAHLGPTIGDLFLDLFNAPPVSAWIYFYGTLLLAIVGLVVCLTNPRSLPFVFKTATLFALSRAFFLILTHLGLPPGAVTVPNPSWFEKLFFQGGLFFSGHAGLPFLFSLIFWKKKPIRIVFQIFTVFLSVIVLLGHLHYSIDVFAALFITHSIYYVSENFFRKDKQRMETDFF